MHQILILASALDDLEAGYHFYEAQAGTLGRYFLDCLYTDIDSLAVTAGVHATPLAGFHRALSKRFPFAIYYEVRDTTACVVAVLDCRRKPSLIRRRLGAR